MRRNGQELGKQVLVTALGTPARVRMGTADGKSIDMTITVKKMEPAH